MKWLKALIVFFVILLIGLLGTAWILGEWGPRYAKEYISEESQLRTGAPLNIETLQWSWKSFTLQADNLQTEQSNLVFQARSATIGFSVKSLSSFLTSPIKNGLLLSIHLTEPRLSFKLSSTTGSQKELQKPSPQTSSAKKDSAIVLPIPLAYSLKISDGDFIFVDETQTVKKQIKLLNTDLSVSSTNINAPLHTELKGALVVETGETRFQLPIALKTVIFPELPTLKTSSSNLLLGPLALTFHGQSNLETDRHNWVVRAQMQNFSKLPELSKHFKGPWQGKLMLESQLAKLGPSDSWHLTGKVHAIDVKGPIEYEKEKISLKGIPVLNLQTTFNFKERLFLTPLIGSFSFSDTSITYKDFFKKENGTPLTLDFSSQLNDKDLQISSGRLQLGPLIATSKGKLSLASTKAEDLLVRVAPTNIGQVSTLFPFLSKQKSEGKIRVEALLNGPLKDWRNLEVRFFPLELQKVKLNVQWSSKKQPLKTATKVNGLIELNALLRGSFRAPSINAKVLNVDANLDSLEISQTELNKKRGQTLRLSILGSHKKEAFQLKRGTLLTPGGAIRISGSSRGYETPSLNLSLIIRKHKLGYLRKWFPQAEKIPLTGFLSSSLKLNGVYNKSTPIDRLPFRLQGNLEYQAKKLVIRRLGKESQTSIKNDSSSSAQKVSTTPNSKPPNRQLIPEIFWPALPDLPILRNSKLTAKWSIGMLDINKIAAQNLIGNLSYNRGIIFAKTSTKKVFDGAVKVRKFSASLYEKKSVSVDLTLEQVNLKKALGYFSKEKSEYASGLFSGKLKANMPALSIRQEIVNGSQGSGTLLLKKGTIEGLKINEFIGRKTQGLSKVLKNPPRIGDTTADYTSNFSFKNDQLKLSLFRVLSNDRKLKLVSKGNLNRSGQLLLQGELRAHPQILKIGGDIARANTDKMGLFVFPQFQVSGDISQPRYKVLKPEKILENTAQFMLKKEKKKLEERAKKAIEKGLQDLFK